MSLPLCGQGFSFYEYYFPQELGGTHPQNWTALQDSNDFLFIGNGAGYIINNGRSWSVNHIGESGRGNSFFLSSMGKFYANGSADFGLIESDSVFNPSYKSISASFYSGDDDIPYIKEVYEIGGKIYNRHNYGIVEYDPKKKEIKDYRIKNNFLWNSFRHNTEIFVDANDGLWVFQDSTYTLLQNLDEFKDERFIFSTKLNEEETLIGIWKGPNRAKEKSIYKYKNGSIKVFETEVDEYLSSNISYRATVLKDGKIVIATLTGGVVFLDEDGSLIKIFSEKNGLHTNEVYNLYVDHEDQLWIMLSDGVQKLDLNESIINYGEVHGIEGTIEEIIEIDGTVWVRSASGVYKSTVLLPEQTLYFKQVSNPSGLQVRGMLSYKDKPYIYGSGGLYELLNNRIGKQLYDQAITSHAMDFEKNTVLFIGYNSVLSFNGSSIIEKPVNFNENVIYSAFYEKELFVTFSMLKKVFKVQRDSLVEVPIQNEAEKIINYNHLDVINDQLYIGTDGLGINNGLFVYDTDIKEFKKSTEFGKDSPLSTKQVFKFAQCENGDLWFTTDRKIIKAVRNGRNWELITRPFNKVSEFAGYSFECTDNGVWAGGVNNLTFIDNNFKADPTSFKTNITGVFIERDSLIFGGYGEPDRAFVIPYKDNELRFNYAAASFIDKEKNSYSVKLEGFENSWSDWNSETQKDYTNIPEGTYTFKVRSQNVYEYEGIPDEFTFTVLPPWYRTWWAYLLYIISTFGIIYLIYKIRINQLLRVQRVRNRIADDLHDDLSGTLIGISNFAKVIDANPDKDVQNRFLGLIQKSADEAKEKISDIVWTINPEHDDWNTFLAKCRRYASDIFESQNIEYSLEMDEVIPGALQMELRKNLWLIFKEIITNIIKHSSADYVLIRFKTDNRKLSILVKDNGKGFELENVEKGNGIDSIKKRVDSIDGEVKLESDPSKGTFWNIEVEL